MINLHKNQIVEKFGKTAPDKVTEYVVTVVVGGRQPFMIPFKGKVIKYAKAQVLAVLLEHALIIEDYMRAATIRDLLKEI